MERIDRLVDTLVQRITVPLEASGRHVHLTRAHVEALFGPGATLTPTKDLSQPGQFACAQRVTLVGPKGRLERVAVLGPERPDSQVEISLTDAVALGITPPVRLSGDIGGTPGVVVANGDRQVTLPCGLMAAKRHIHLSPQEGARLGVEDKQVVSLHTLTARPVVFGEVEVRISPKFSAAAHLDYDEANACGFRPGDRGLIAP